MEEEFISLKDLWRAIRRSYIWIVGGAVVGLLVALIVTLFFIKPQYTETSSVKSDVPVSEVLINTYTKFVKSENYLESVSNALKAEKIDVSPSQLSSMVEFTWSLNTQVMEFKVTGSNKNVGAIANELASQFSKMAVDELPDNVFYAYPEVANQTITSVNEIMADNLSSKFSAEDYMTFRTIVDDQIKFSITEIFDKLTKNMMKNDNFQVLTKANLNSTKTSPKMLVNVIIGMAIGFIVGVGVVCIMQFSSGTIADVEYLQKMSDMPNLGIISSK